MNKREKYFSVFLAVFIKRKSNPKGMHLCVGISQVWELVSYLIRN